MRRQAGFSSTARQQRCAPSMLRQADITGDFSQCWLNQRADLAFVGRIADTHDLRCSGKRFTNLGAKCLLDKDALTRRCSVRCRSRSGEQRGVQRALNVGIFKNQHRDLIPPSSIEYFSGRHFYDIATGGGTAGKRHRTHVMRWRVRQRRPPSRRSPRNHVHSTRLPEFASSATSCPTCRQSTVRFLDILSDAVLPSCYGHGATFQSRSAGI